MLGSWTPVEFKGIPLATDLTALPAPLAQRGKSLSVGSSALETRSCCSWTQLFCSSVSLACGSFSLLAAAALGPSWVSEPRAEVGGTGEAQPAPS